MVTIKQIAEAAGVSTTTVSNVIHGKTKKVSPEKIEEIQQLIVKLGYIQPLGLNVLHKKQSHMVAVIINRHQVYEQSILNDPFYGSVIGYIEEELHKKGYYMLFYSAVDVDDIFTMVMTWNVDGVILVSMTTRDTEKIRYMINKPVVCIDPIITGNENIKESASSIQGVGYVCLDDRKGGYLMVQHLIQLGYQVIYICGSKLDFGVDLHRVEGARKALKDSGKEDSVQLVTISAGISFTERVGFYEYIYKNYPFEQRTAIFCTADRYALEIGSYLQERGIVIPEQIGLTGFDGISYIARHSYPRLTTIRQNVFQKAELSVKEMIQAVENPDYQMKNHILDVQLVIRASDKKGIL